MNLNHLALFRAVAEEGSVSRGAERLHISQPAVSKQLSEFEASLGVRLFDRVPKGVRLTEAGQLLLDYARRLFTIEADAERAIVELKGLERGRLCIGASTTIGSYLLPNALAQFHRLHPYVEIEARIGNTEDIQRALREGVIDVGFTEGFVEEEDLEAHVFYTDELVVIASSSHPLVRAMEPVSIHHLIEEPFVLREAGSGTRAVLERALESAAIPLPRTVMTLAATEAIKHTVMAGIGISVVSRLAVETELTMGTLALIPLSDLPRLHRPLHCLRPKSRHEGHSVRAFLSVLRLIT